MSVLLQPLSCLHGSIHPHTIHLVIAVQICPIQINGKRLQYSELPLLDVGHEGVQRLRPLPEHACPLQLIYKGVKPPTYVILMSYPKFIDVTVGCITGSIRFLCTWPTVLSIMFFCCVHLLNHILSFSWRTADHILIKHMFYHLKMGGEFLVYMLNGPL